MPTTCPPTGFRVHNVYPAQAKYTAGCSQHKTYRLREVAGEYLYSYIQISAYSQHFYQASTAVIIVSQKVVGAKCP